MTDATTPRRWSWRNWMDVGQTATIIALARDGGDIDVVFVES